MAFANIQIRLDDNLKQEFTSLCDELGLTVSAACLVFIKKAVNEQRIPFELSVAGRETQAEKKVNGIEKD